MTVPNLNRSSSPLSSRPIPNSRNSESNSTTRRSFSGNPFQKPPALANPRSFNSPTPANSPAGFGRRQSDHNEKENDQGIKPVKSRSTAIGFGSKNFMAPTISAACKMSPSPRKKVLVDRNEAVRTSISLSEGKATFFSSNDEDILHKFESSIDQKNAEVNVPEVLKRVRFAASTLDSGNSIKFEANSVVSDFDCVVTDLNTKNKSFCDSKTLPDIAPLDADPSVPPYDPNTNYLSPRPEFLHYKPNERIEILVNKENGLDDEGVKLFEDNLSSSENTSDTDESLRDPEDSSAAEKPEIEPPKVRGEEDVHGSESLICGKKKGLVTKLGLILLLVVLLVSCFSISVTYSPGTSTDSTMLKTMNISQLHQPGVLIDLAKAKFNGFTQKFKQLSIESISHLSLLVNNIGQEAQLSSVQFSNMTELQNNDFDGGYLKKSPEYLGWDYMEEEIDGWNDTKHEVETFGDCIPDSNSENEAEKDGDELVLTEAFPAAAGGPFGGLAASETICNQEEDVSHLNTDWQDNVVPPEHTPETHEVLTESSIEKVEGSVNLGSDVNVKPSSEDTNLQTVSDISIGSSPEEFEGNVVPEIQEVLAESSLKMVEGKVNVGSNANVKPSLEDTNLQTECSPAELEDNVNLDFADPNVEPLPKNISLKTPSDFIPHPTIELPSEIEPFTYHVMGATALALAVVSIAFAIYKYRKRGNNANEPNDAVGIDHLLSKKTVFATSSSTMKQMYHKKQYSQNWPTEDDVGESCSSEMSSFQRNSSEYEAQSGGERRQTKYSKRESFSSSDFSLGGGGSSSYGSFTAFERVPIKNDEVVTPVRRSSRLRRSQVTS